MRVLAVALRLLIMLAPLAPTTTRADEPLSFDRFAALVQTVTALMVGHHPVSDGDAATWREVILHPTASTAGYAQRIALDPHRPLDERVVATLSQSQLPEAARVDFATPIVDAVVRNRALLRRSGYEAYSLLEAALRPAILSASSFGSPAGQALLARARSIDGLDARLAWSIDTARGAAHPHLDDSAFGRLLEAIAVLARTGEERHGLAHVIAFRDIAKDPAPYRKAVLRAVRDDKLSIDARIVAVLLMEGLPDNDLYPFHDQIVQATLDGSIPKTPGKVLHIEKSILAAALFPQPPYMRANILFSNDPRARALVAKAKRANDPTAFELDEAAHSQELLAAGPSYDAYVKAITTVAGYLAHRDWYDGATFGNPDFLAMYEYPEPYRALAERAIHDPAVDLDARIVAALTLQPLPQDKLLDVLDRLVADAAMGRLDMRRGTVSPDTILEAALFPRVNYNAYLSLAPDAPRVRPLLLAAQRIGGLPDTLKSQIADALSGKRRTELLESYGGVEPFPRLDYVRAGKDASIQIDTPR